MATSRTIVFRYKIAGGRPAPMVSVGLKLGDVWRPVEFYVDSGAAYTILRSKVADDVGFHWQSGRRILAQVGDGGLIPVHLHELPMQIGAKRFKAIVGFSAKLGVPFNLLGRLSVFERFKICFVEKRRIVSFLPLE